MKITAGYNYSQEFPLFCENNERTKASAKRARCKVYER